MGYYYLKNSVIWSRQVCKQFSSNEKQGNGLEAELEARSQAKSEAKPEAKLNTELEDKPESEFSNSLDYARLY